MKKSFLVSAIVLLAFVGGYFYFRDGKSSPYEYFTVQRGDLVQEVSVTGKVKPVKNADLAFERSGRVTSVVASIGDVVGAGQALAYLDAGELSAQLAKAEADAETQRAKLERSRLDLANAYRNILTAVNDAYAKADDAVRKQLDNFFLNDDSDNPRLSFLVSDPSIAADAERLRFLAGLSLKALREVVNRIDEGSPRVDLENALGEAKSHLVVVRELLVRALDAATSASNASFITQEMSAAYKANVNTGRTNVNGALANLNGVEQSVAMGSANIATDEAGLKSFEASVANIRAQLAKTVLRSPFRGTVTRMDIRVGEIAVPNAAVVSVISSGAFEIEANVPEADIAKVKTGNSARVTLDAYGNDVMFEATVTRIDPAEQVIEGVSTYKVTLSFPEYDVRVKSGMTANIDILTAMKSQVFFVPQRALVSKNGDKFVRLLDVSGREVREAKVVTGLRDSQGNIEILEGVEDGDRVIITER